MRKKVCLYVLSVVVLCTPSYAALSFNMTCANPVVAIGEETTIIVSAKDPDAVADYGLVDWQFDMWLDVGDDGILEVVSTGVFDLPGEDVYATAFYGPIENSPTSGSVDSFGAFQAGVDPLSNLGVGTEYVPIASITVKGIAEGSVAYNFGSLTTPDNFYGRFRDSNSEVLAAFDSGSSVVNFTVVPEPATILILSGFSVVALIRRKRS